MKIPYLKKVIDYTVPVFGNKRILPYATLLVSDGENTKIIKTKEDQNGQYIVFKRKRYGIKNLGSLYCPRLQITEY